MVQEYNEYFVEFLRGLQINVQVIQCKASVVLKSGQRCWLALLARPEMLYRLTYQAK